MNDMTLEQKVHHNLNVASEENEVSFSSWCPEEIAVDLITYAQDMEDYTVEDLVPHIRTWLDKV